MTNFEEVSNEIINKINQIKFEEKEKEIIKLELTLNIIKFIGKEENYRENCKILNRNIDRFKKLK